MVKRAATDKIKLKPKRKPAKREPKPDELQIAWRTGQENNQTQ